MRALSSILMLLGIVSALLLGALAGAAEAAPAPCHDAVAAGHSVPADETPEDGDRAMNCCVACVGAPVIAPPARSRMAFLDAAPHGRAPTLPPGLSPAPEPGPPR